MITLALSESLAELTHELRADTLGLADYVDRLERHFDRREPSVRAFMPEEGRFDRLRQEALRLIGLYPEPASRPPLFGVPIGVKDIFRVDGFATTAGSRLPVETLGGTEAAAVSALRAAGALVMGKTVSTEFAYFAPGVTRNPHDPERTPGGSSSGSAAAVGAGLCPLTLGTQTIGSISRPASFCGIVGFKPSYGRICAAGVIPLAPSLDHVGCFTADVAGARLTAQLLCKDWVPAARPQDRLVLGVPEGPYLERADEATLEDFRACLDRLREADYVVRSISTFGDFAAIDTRHRALVAAEAAIVHADWYTRYGDRYAPETVELIEHGRRVSRQELDEARQGRARLRRQLSELMNEHQLDLWVSPAALGPAPRGLAGTGDPVMSLPWTHAGLPTLSLPAWERDSLPLGLQLAGRWQGDETMLAEASRIEEALAP